MTLTGLVMILILKTRLKFTSNKIVNSGRKICTVQPIFKVQAVLRAVIKNRRRRRSEALNHSKIASFLGQATAKRQTMPQNVKKGCM